MDECQLRTVYRAGTEKSPVFEANTNDEVWLIQNPALYYPLDNQDERQRHSPKEAVKLTVCLWEAKIKCHRSSLSITDHPMFKGVCVVKSKRKVESLCWEKVPVPQCQPGLSMMDSQVVMQAVLHYLIDNPPTTPEDFNFQAELKAASHWHWPKDDEPLKFVSCPYDDLHVKKVAAIALKSWKEELNKARIKENTDSSDDLQEYISDLEEVIFNLSMSYKGTLEETTDDNSPSISSHKDNKQPKIEKWVSPRRKRKHPMEIGPYTGRLKKRSTQSPGTHNRKSLTVHYIHTPEWREALRDKKTRRSVPIQGSSPERSLNLEFSTLAKGHGAVLYSTINR